MMLDRLYRPVFIRHIVSVMLITTTESILESNSQNCVGQNSEQALNTPLFIHNFIADIPTTDGRDKKSRGKLKYQL